MVLPVAFAGLTTVSGQPFRITSGVLSNSVLQMTFPGRADSYYFMLAGSSLTVPSGPVAAVLGTNGNQTFQRPVNGGATMFFRVQQLPQTGANDQDLDGIPDAWELQHGLNPLYSSDANQVPLGDTRTWLQIYHADAVSS